MAMKDNEYQGDKKEESGAYITERGQNTRRQDQLQKMHKNEWAGRTRRNFTKGRDLNSTETDEYLILREVLV